MQTYIDNEADLSRPMRNLAERLARGRCDMIVAHDRNHISFYNEGSEVWPDHFRAVEDHGGHVRHAGRKPLPDPDARSVVFARYDAEEGKERGWMEVRTD